LIQNLLHFFDLQVEVTNNRHKSGIGIGNWESKEIDIHPITDRRVTDWVFPGKKKGKKKYFF
jgi:hypothetical protein